MFFKQHQSTHMLKNHLFWITSIFTVTDKRDLGIGYVELFLSLLKLILQHGRPYKTLLEDVLKTITRGTIFLTATDQSLPKIIRTCSYETNDKFHLKEQGEFLCAELIRSFCRDAVRLVPSVTHCLLPTIAAISKKISSPATQSFLYTLLSLNSAAENGFTTSVQTWMELPLLPNNDELAGHFVEKDQNLTPVRTHVPYDDPEQYMDTYFRLVRAETFSAIQHGIKDLKASTLDQRDMNVYYNIHLAGFALQSGRFSLAINFTPTKEVKKWEASPQLMFGNLVCLSINRNFDDVIWATVSNRDTDLLNKLQIITLELLDENVKTISEIIYSLQIQGGKVLDVAQWLADNTLHLHDLYPENRDRKRKAKYYLNVVRAACLLMQ